MSEETLRWRTTKGKDGSLQWEGVPPYNKDEAFRKFEPEQMGIRYGQARTGCPCGPGRSEMLPWDRVPPRASSLLADALIG